MPNVTGQWPARRWIALANDQVSIRKLLESLGIDADPASPKAYCPFGQISHSDGGVEKSLRVYEDNTAYCFAGCGTFTPAWLMSQVWDIRQGEAARRLCQEIGIAPVTVHDAVALLEPAPDTPDPAALAEALRVWVVRTRGTDAELTSVESVTAAYARCLGLLERVHGATDGVSWLSTCKTYLARIFEGVPDGHPARDSA